MIMNLLKETLAEIESLGKTPKDIVFIGNVDSRNAFSVEEHYYCSWDEFVVLADREYDSGYGSAQVPLDLKIVFDDNTWFERYAYDGRECWVYQELCSVPTEVKQIKNLFSLDGFECSLAEINK